jgi:hypothetical protein
LRVLPPQSVYNGSRISEGRANDPHYEIRDALILFDLAKNSVRRIRTAEFGVIRQPGF